MAGDFSVSSDQSESVEARFEQKIKYTDHGFILCSRKWLGRELARYPSAFTIYFHLVAWANYKDGELKRGQVAIGERDFGVILGMSVTTVRKWLRWLRDAGWILLEPVRHGKERGTIVTIVNYELSQGYRVYELPSEDQKMILTPAPLEDQKTILTEEGEDQNAILTPPSQDQKMIPHIINNSLENTDDASRQRCPGGQISGESEHALPVTTLKPAGLVELYAKLNSLGVRGCQKLG